MKISVIPSLSRDLSFLSSSRHPDLVEGSVQPVAAVYDRRVAVDLRATVPSVAVAGPRDSSVIPSLSRDQTHSRTLNTLPLQNSVILSEGEPVRFLFPTNSPEPQSKDLAEIINAFEWRQKISLQKASPSPAKFPLIKIPLIWPIL
jgi:hypothetical protein